MPGVQKPPSKVRWLASITACSSAGKHCDLAGSKKFLWRHDHNPSVVTAKKGGKRKGKDQLQWGQDQDWTPVQTNLRFIDKSHDLDFLEDSETEDGSNEDEGAFAAVPNWPVVEDALSRDVSSTSYPNSSSRHYPETQALRTFNLIDALVTSNEANRSPESLVVLQPSSPHTTIGQWRAPYVQNKLFVPPSLPDSECIWPLQNADEVLLLRHFTIDLCLWFDYCDRDKHFQNVVLPASATDPTLTNAILAVSARHLGLQGKFDRYAADRYQQKCLETLIPELNDHDTIPKDLLFAGTIILRLLDEMTEDDPIFRSQGHGLSTRNLIRGREETLSDSSLRVTCIRIELRQEVIISFLTRKPVPMLAQYCDINRGLGPSDDCTWTFRIIACLADCLNLCYGEKRQNAMEEYERLSEYVAQWARNCPPTFKPIGSSPPDETKGEILPKIWFLNDCHVGAQHYLGLARILLLAHDPTIPSIGLDRKMRSDQIDKQIRGQVRLLAGSAVSNRQHVSAMFTAGSAIAMCGERFSDPVEQKVLLDVLTEAEEHVAWPSLRFQHILRGLWGM
ncbi:hypothetical protein BDZ45DRAFT_433576 [Acephala macrosclerotiorum]|nr:hypothetical protein BDZ45DRAFT_433576 [Acephala macrosclerotiorum]